MVRHEVKSSYSVECSFVYTKQHIVTTNQENTILFTTFQPGVDTLGQLWMRAIAGGPLSGGPGLGLQPQPTKKRCRPAYVEHPLLENTLKTPTGNQHF